MTATADVLAVVLFVFFVVGVGVGILIVIALSARRADKASRPSRQRIAPVANAGYFGDEPDDGSGDEPPRWPTRDGD